MDENEPQDFFSDRRGNASEAVHAFDARRLEIYEWCEQRVLVLDDSEQFLNDATMGMLDLAELFVDRSLALRKELGPGLQTKEYITQFWLSDSHDRIERFSKLVDIVDYEKIDDLEYERMVENVIYHTADSDEMGNQLFEMYFVPAQNDVARLVRGVGLTRLGYDHEGKPYMPILSKLGETKAASAAQIKDLSKSYGNFVLSHFFRQ